MGEIGGEEAVAEENPVSQYSHASCNLQHAEIYPRANPSPEIIPIFRQAHNNLDIELIAYIYSGELIPTVGTCLNVPNIKG